MLTRKNKKAAKAAKKEKPEEAIVVAPTAPAAANKQAKPAVASLVPTSNSSLGEYTAPEGFDGGEVVTATPVVATATLVGSKSDAAAPLVAAVPAVSTSTKTNIDMKDLLRRALELEQRTKADAEERRAHELERERAAEERRALRREQREQRRRDLERSREQEREAEARRALEDHVYQQEREQDEFRASIYDDVSMNRRGYVQLAEQVKDQAEFLEGLGYSPKKK